MNFDMPQAAKKDEPIEFSPLTDEERAVLKRSNVPDVTERNAADPIADPNGFVEFAPITADDRNRIALMNSGEVAKTDGSDGIEFVPSTDEEKAALGEAKAAGIAKNIETGGSGAILSAQEKAAGWYGESSESTTGLEKSAEMTRVQAERPKDSETTEVALSRQISDIAGKMAEVLSNRIRTTDDAERARLQKLEETLKKGLDIKKREYDALVPSQVAGVDSVASEEHFSA